MSIARAVAEVAHSLATFDLDRATAVPDVLPRVRELLETEIVCVYSLADAGASWEFSRYHGVGLPHSFRRRFNEFLATGPRRYGAFDAGCPEPAQRNRVIESTALLDADAPPVATQRVFEPLGLAQHGHLRVLLCEGASLLGWFGTLSRERFTPRHRMILRALARPMHRRLLAERVFERGKLATVAMDALLEAVAAPAFIVDGAGGIRELNGAARRVLETRGTEIRAALVDAVAGKPTLPRVEMTHLQARGIGDHWLAVVHVDRVEACVAAAAQRYRLTQREAEVLLWVARGSTNQRIAAELACSERNIEAHLARMFGKTDVASRTALVALVLT